MVEEDSNITLFDDTNNIPYKYENFTANNTNYQRWPLDECINNNFTNDTSIEISNVLYFYNETKVRCLAHAPILTQSTTIKVAILLTIAFLSFIGNIATMISIKRGKRRKSKSRPSWTAIYSLIFQLSIADVLVTMFCIVGDAAWSFTVQWYAGNVACKLFKFLQMFSLHLSTFVLVLIGVDRWLAVKYPMKSMATATRNGRLVIIAWILSFVLSIPQVIVFRVVQGPFYEEFYQCATHGFYTERWQEQTYLSLSLFFIFILPLIILVSTYVSTVRTIAKSEKVFKPEVESHVNYLTPDQNRRKLINRAKMKSLRMSVVIVAAFIIWWTPYHVMMIIFTFMNPDKNQSDDLLKGIFFFGMSNSLVNPIIYGAFHLWPKKKNRTRESGAHHFLRRDQNTSSIRLTTTIRPVRYSADYIGHITSKRLL